MTSICGYDKTRLGHDRFKIMGKLSSLKFLFDKGDFCYNNIITFTFSRVFGLDI